MTRPHWALHLEGARPTQVDDFLHCLLVFDLLLCSPIESCPALHSQSSRPLVWPLSWVGGNWLAWASILLYDSWRLHLSSMGWGAESGPWWLSWGSFLVGLLQSLWAPQQRGNGHSIGVWRLVIFWDTTQLYHSTFLCCETQEPCCERSSFSSCFDVGAPVAFRANSQWAGTWTGVAVTSDVPCQEVHLPYNGEHSCGRVMASQHTVGGLNLTNVVVYGYPSGPTWPKAKELTSQLLQVVATEIILGGRGPRIVGGDFNCAADGLDIFSYWKQLGWRSAQELAGFLWQQDLEFTCKHSTERDIVWLSPEAQALCGAVDVTYFFAEHATVSVGLRCSLTVPMELAWKLPSRIPWTEVSDAWKTQTCAPVWNTTGSADDQWAQLGASLEQSLAGHLPAQPGHKLQPAQCGRLQPFAPQKRQAGCKLLRASRPSEVVLRNDLIGTETRLWFRQLRRLQSYLAAIKAGKQTLDAIHYRLLLWSSIRQSPGFVDGFPAWWCNSRGHVLPEAPRLLPSGPPDVEVAQLIFDNFKLCFDAFESWHLRQRIKLLKSKYDAGMQGIYHDLKKPAKDQLDFLTQTHEHAVLATSDDGLQIHLANEVSNPDFSKFTLNGHVVQPEFQGDLATFPSPVACETGDVMIQHRTITEVHSLHQMLLDFWTPVWNQASQLLQVDASRLEAFVDAYVPRIDFDIQPITISQWRKALRRFKKSAARGVDGIHPEDLLNMPTAWTERLLDLLHSIETGSTDWPSALRTGIVRVLAKEHSAASVDRFRPIVIFSVIYRAWASLRARQLLVQLRPYMVDTALGFVPGCETSQLWMTLQGTIELALQENAGLCGLSTDLIRAFNFIPREQTFMLAEKLGVPSRVTRPWALFLATCTRSFTVRNCLSSATTSTSGMPEGDALSVYAMVQLSLAFHKYMQLTNPAVTTLSYVDNLTLVARHPFPLLLGLLSLIEFFRLWQLQIDLVKSHCWTLLAQFSSMMDLIGIQRTEAVPELGGVLSFTKRQFTGLPLARIAKLEPLWDRLRASQAPCSHKIRCLPVMFWSAALYGANAASLGESHIDKLRTRALRALRLGKAGVNPKARLSFSCCPTADPGFWRLSNTFAAFRRIAHKEPGFVAAWKRFMSNFDGKFFSGPFSQILSVGNQIGWHFCPPFFTDHDGLEFNLLTVDDTTLANLLLDGWYQFVARSLCTRKMMQDLQGLDTSLMREILAPLGALEVAQVGALQAGAFMSAASQSKFDLTKKGLCALCQVADDQLHWQSCPRFDSLKRDIPGWTDEHRLDSTALRAHLLPSRSPFIQQWKTMLVSISDCTGAFDSIPCEGLQHLFTDGTVCGGSTAYAFAGWGCLNATTGQVVAAGHVPGLCQSSDRAELFGAIAALRWTLRFGATVHLWLDSQYVANCLLFVLQHGFAGRWAHHDLWQMVVDLVEQLDFGQLTVHWVPSHLASAAMECPFEDWVRTWNNQVDGLAGAYNFQRSRAFFSLRDAAVAHHSQMRDRCQQLQKFFSAVAAADASSSTEPTDAVEHFGFVSDRCTISDLYILPLEQWVPQCESKPADLPAHFVIGLYSLLMSFTDINCQVYPLCFEELALWLAKDGLLDFPFWDGSLGRMETRSLCDRFERPTLSYLIRWVKRALDWLLNHVDGSEVLFSRYDKVSLGIHKPVAGVYIRLTVEAVQRCSGLMIDFSRSRPIRKVCDLARAW